MLKEDAGIIDFGYGEEFAGTTTVERTIVGPPDIPKDDRKFCRRLSGQL
jgi:hypothetical protein